MQVTVLKEEGHDLALRGMAYSFKDRALDTESWWEGQRERAEKRAPLLAPKGLGHSKFLESIQVWIDVEASRAFWSEFDTYRVGITKQSESTMHTLAKREPTIQDFEVNTPLEMIRSFIAVWNSLKKIGMDIAILKESLPEGFLQRRLVSMNYATLRNIIKQRSGHRYMWWDVFIKNVLDQVEHPEYLIDKKE